MNSNIRLIAVVSLWVGSILTAHSADDLAGQSTGRHLAPLGLEQLLQIEVTTASRSDSTVGESPAAVFVITPEMIRRSGATSLPELFRMAPGLNVARIDAHRWAISIRGFNQEFANKLLVLIDGRAVYSPLFSGVRWEQQDVVLEDIERIEVIRGPAAALWGPNAINGVINIITKGAAETQGLLLSSGYGTEDPGFGTLRYGGKLADGVHYRVYVKGQAYGDSKFPNGTSSADSWNQERGGFRIDWSNHGDNRFTLQGDVASGEPHELVIPANTTTIVPATIQFLTGNLRGRWTHTLGPDSDFSLQAYFDHAERDVFNQSERLDTVDLDFQHRFPWGDRQAMTWGLGYRLVTDEIVFQAPISFTPARRNIHLPTAFVRDDIQLIKDRLALTLGTEVEYYTFTGLDWQPTARLHWSPTKRQTVWAAVSRALRTPSRADNDLQVTGPPLAFSPNPALHPEGVLAYEIGYRAQCHDRLALDLTAFYNDYTHLRSVEILSVSPLVQMRDEKLQGETYGAEATLMWQPVDRWKLQLVYSYLQMRLRQLAGSTDTSSAPRDEGRNPQQTISVLSTLDLTRTIEFDGGLRFVDGLRSLPPFPNIPSYVALDLRLAWHLHPNLELAIVGQNLLDNQHPEFLPGAFGTLGQPREVQRSVYGKVTWKF